MTLPAAAHNYECNVSETENYTLAYNSSTFTINKIQSTVNLTLNSTDANITTEVYGPKYIDPSLITFRVINTRGNGSFLIHIQG